MKKQDFPIFRNNRRLVYLDSAATSQKPRQVLRAIDSFLRKDNANIGRGSYVLSERAMSLYNNARETVAGFIGAEPEEIIFTKNTTEALNLLSYTLKDLLKKGKTEIVLTEMEHHSNIVPWQQMAKRLGFKLKYIKLKSNFTLDMKDAKKQITNKVGIFSFCHVSNVLGTINPIKQLVKLAKAKNAITIVDAAQSVSRLQIDVKSMGCDFLVFSSHKILGPSGVGVLYGRKELLKQMPPFLTGGGTIKTVGWYETLFSEIPQEKFEAGTQNIAAAIGLAEAVKYIEKIGLENIESWEKMLTDYTIGKLSQIKGIEIYHPNKNDSVGIISFNIIGIHPHDVSELLNQKRIAIRAGHCCAMPLVDVIGAEKGGVCRASFYIYNTLEDVDQLIEGIKFVKKRFEV